MRTRMTIFLLAFIVAIAKEFEPTAANVLFRFGTDDFSLGFHIKSDDSSTDDDNDDDNGAFEKMIIFDNNHITVRNNRFPYGFAAAEDEVDEMLTKATEQPIFNDEFPLETTTTATTTTPPHPPPLIRSMTDFWTQELNLTDSADLRLKEIVESLTKLNTEISPVLESSEYLTQKVRLIIRYLNNLDAVAAAEADESATPAFNRLEYLRKFTKLVDKLKQPAAGVGNTQRTLDYILFKLLLEKYRIVELQAEVMDEVKAAEEAWQQYVKAKLVEVAV